MLRRLMIASGAQTTDPYWNNVVSLLHFDGADDGTVFTDQKSRTWAAVGGAKTTAGTKKWGAAAGDFNGVDAYISTPHTPEMNVGAGNFTVEAWVYLRARTSYAIFVAKGNSYNATLPVLLSLESTGTSAQFGCGNPSAPHWNIAVANVPLPLNQWVHLAGVREGNLLRLFQQGVLVGTASISGVANDNSAPLSIGANAPGSASANSFANVVVDDFRFTPGVARYTAAFAPPVAAFPNS